MGGINDYNGYDAIEVCPSGSHLSDYEELKIAYDNRSSIGLADDPGDFTSSTEYTGPAISSAYWQYAWGVNFASGDKECIAYKDDNHSVLCIED